MKGGGGGGEADSTHILDTNNFLDICTNVVKLPGFFRNISGKSF